MVKGISKQVIVVDAHDEALFEQAIFILRESALRSDGVTDEMLLREAKMLLGARSERRDHLSLWSLLWACSGALITGAAWVATMFL